MLDASQRTFRNAWLHDDDFKWLLKVNGNHQKAFCNACSYEEVQMRQQLPMMT